MLILIISAMLLYLIYLPMACDSLIRDGSDFVIFAVLISNVLLSSLLPQPNSTQPRVGLALFSYAKPVKPPQHSDIASAA